MKKIRLPVFLVIAVILFAAAGKSFAQIDWSDYRIVEPQKMNVVFPLAYNIIHEVSPLFVSVVVTNGAFDNYKISGVGFCETDCAVNPRNSLNLLSCDNNAQNGSGIYGSTDGGISWVNGSGVTSNQGDPVVCFDSLGNGYLAVLQNGVRVIKTTNGGLSWVSPVTVVTNANADKEWIAADQTSGPFKNNVYVVYVNFATGATVDFWRSTNNGANWTGPQNLGSGTPNPGPDIETGPNGEVYVAWYGGGGTFIRKSTDGGATFSAFVVASNHSQPGSIGAGGRFVLKNNIRVNGMPHFAVDMSSGPNRGNLYLTFCSNPAGPDKADIFMTRSTDGGATWNTGSQLRVNDDATTTDQFMNDVSVDAQGRVWVMWYDSRIDPTNNVMTELYSAVSTNGGVSFMPNIKVSNKAFDANGAAIGQGSDANYIGDYQGMAGKNFTVPVWMDNRAGFHPDYIAYLPDFGMLLDKTLDTITPGGSVSHKLLMPVMGPYSGTVTLTSTITPSPAPGTVTVNFVPGNVRTFTGDPDSVTVNITSTSNVPNSYYVINITGTETGGPRVHSRTDSVMITNSIGIHGNSSEVPKSFALYQNYPNPFNPSTKIEYALPKNAFVTLKVYDVLGREVADLIKGENKTAGFYELNFDAALLPSGIYFYKLSAGDFNEVMKMVLLK